ncbi:hypothetical protein T492DRAFT_1078854 [Pavlovales sp. CCMP2436]|nr:hypothetical protein T492DRAFT_1078854 [Pavlovales sp. CCMP2436]|mmetsp:Transcript_9144/g.23205  ORF Transcript_9144/g.23205 Transcript_9144/m.23205 type:complete len:174 (-) Transcript_9144:174-695(-)
MGSRSELLVLCGMFPDVDTELLSDILRANQNDMAATIEQVLEMATCDAPHGYALSDIPSQIEQDAELAMALQSEETSAPPSRGGGASVLDHLQRLGLADGAEGQSGWGLMRQIEFEFARPHQDDHDEGIDVDIPERVIKGAARSRARAARPGTACSTGLHRRQRWCPSSLPAD